MPEPALTSRANVTGKGLRACERHWEQDSGPGERIAADDQVHTSCLQGQAGCVYVNRAGRVSREWRVWEGGRGGQLENPGPT